VATFSDLFARLDPDPRLRGKQFEHVCKWFLTNDPMYKHELRRVWLWQEWPGRWGADAGIDLVAEDRNGGLWAIQAKAYDPAYRVTKRDVDRFLAESGRAIFSYRMLIATTDLIDRIGERTIQDQEKRVSFFRLNDLQAADVDWPASPTALRPTRPLKPARPHDYQREAIKNVVKGFESADRGQLIMACGTGKTLTALFIREKLAAERTLVLVPSLSLLKQTLNVWRGNCTTEFVSLPVCSDDTVARDDDVALEHTSDLGVPVTTDPSEIAAFLRRRSGPQVVFATYQSSPQIAKAFTLGRVPGFDLVVADEAHRCAGPVSSDFATVLDPVEIKAKRRLFMTATPRYFTGRVLKATEEAEFEYASMDDEAKFGRVFHRLGFGEAIKRDLLTDYQVAIVGVDDATCLEWATKAVLVTRDGVEVTDAASLAGQIGLAKAIRKYDLHRVISFHSRVKRAREFAASMPDVLAWMPARQRPKGDLWSRYASGEMPAGDRYVLLQHLGRLDDGDRGLLANARCLAEGVDVPTLDGVAFIDPRRAEVDIVQAVGRAIRKSEDKNVGTIVIPVFIDTNADPEVALDSSLFKPVWDVLKALRAHDEELSAQLDTLRRAMGRKGSRPKLPDKIHVDIPVKVNADFARAFDIRLVEQTTTSWEFWFGMLERYIAENGDPLVPARHKTVEGAPLGSWVARHRQQFQKGILSAERIKRLGNLKGWVWDIDEADWEKSYSNYLRYIEEGGYPSYSLPKDFNGFGARKFVSKQREQFKKGILSAERIKKLNAIDGWTWTAEGAAWNRGFSHYLRYVEEGGDPSSCGDKRVNGFPVGSWVGNQRAVRDQLTAEQVKRLEAVDGWVWKVHDTAWEKNFSNYLRYIATGGDPTCCDVNVEFDGFRVGQWVRTQRQSFSKGTISVERIKKLSNVNGWLWKTPDAWESAFNNYLLFVKESGDPALVKQSVPMATVMFNGSRVGLWVNTQRTAYANNKLSAERVKLLESVDGWVWSVRKSGPRKK
jgi:superfamily II DNA or RNA helicase